MRIISSYKDYYDCIQAYDQEYKPEFIREYSSFTTQLPFIDDIDGENTSARALNWRQRCVTNRFDAEWIGFCGTLYPLFVHYGWKDRTNIYNIEALDAYVQENWSKRNREEYFEDKNKEFRHTAIGFFNRKVSCEYLEQYPIFAIRQKDIYKQLVNRHSSIVKGGCEVIVNPNLKDYDFVRVIDPHTAYQELSMWHNNLAEPEKTIPEIDDRTMVEIKGFDPKWSFRKEPSKKKGKKQT